MDVYCVTLYLCKYTVLSVVLLQDVLEGQLNLLLEFFHLHLLLQPRPVWKGDEYDSLFLPKSPLMTQLHQ